MKRRTYLTAAGSAATAALAGCAGFQGGNADETDATPKGTDSDGTATGTELSGTLTIATYPSFVDSDGAAGPWLKKQFESQHEDVTVEFETPDSELNYFIQRRKKGVPIDTDLYIGLNVDHLLRLDSELDEPLFDEMSGELDGGDRVKEGLQFDPQGRAVPYDTGYISIVYDESKLSAPKSFDDLTTDEFADSLIVENAQSSATGRAFLLWSIKAKGPENYLDYWRALDDNGITILGSWDDAYAAYSNGEKPSVVSYSTDQVYANRYGEEMTRHQVAFLNDQGYANPEGMARFADADDELTAAFMEFMLTSEAQGEIAVRNVQFPAVPDANLPEEFAKYAKEPAEPVTFTYEELKGNVDGWVEDWAREIAQG